MKTLKDYDKEVMNSLKKLGQVVLWSDFEDFDGFVEQLVKEYRESTVILIQNELNISVNQSIFFDNPRIVHLVNEEVCYSMIEVFKSIDASSDYEDDSLTKTLCRKVVEETRWFDSEQLNNDILDILCKELFFFSKCIYFQKKNNEIKIYLGLRKKEHFELVLDFLVNMRKRYFAVVGASVGSEFYNETSSLEFTQELMNDTFLLFSKLEFKNRKYFYKNGENDPYLDALIWHNEPLIKAFERIKLPTLTTTPTQLAEKGVVEITGEYKDLGADIKASLGNNSTKYFALLVFYAERCKGLSFGNVPERKEFAKQQTYNGDTFYNHYYCQLN